MIQTYELKRIPLWPVAKLIFIVLLVVGIIIAIFYTILFSGLSFLATTFGESPFGGDLVMLRRLGLMLIPIIALSYAVFGTIASVIWVLIYNLIAAVVGGIELALSPKVELPAVKAPGQETPIPERPVEGF